MRKSVKIRKIIYEILIHIYEKSSNYEQSFLIFTNKTNLNEQERSMIYNISLNSMRLNLFISSIIKKYLKKRTKNKIKMLLLSAITQIIYLDFKDYAVTNDTVEIAKLKNLNPGLVNSLLKNIIRDRQLLKVNDLDYDFIPKWFLNALKNYEINLGKFFRSISKEPSLHLVFKNEKFLINFKEKHIKTSKISAFIIDNSKISEIDNYAKGQWWVQDFSSMLPIHLSPEIKSKNIIDLCSAPGGKAFQAITMGGKLNLNEISLKRIKILKENLNRLCLKAKITNSDALILPEQHKFDIVILDAPCSGIGTVRRNPEILFKKNQPSFAKLNEIQSSLILKASKLLKTKGILIYMVCSFFYDETIGIKKNFLKENKFNLSKKNELLKFVNSEGDICCAPSKYKNYMVDGFYTVKFIKND